MRFKIAVVQFRIEQFEPEINLKRMEKFIQRAKKSEANVIIFPEDCVTGPLMRRKEFVDRKGFYKKFFQKLAQKYRIDIIPGSFIEVEKNKWFNTSYYIDSFGKIKVRYKKVNLWLPERTYISPGNRAVAFNTKYGKTGLIICWDIVFPETIRKIIKGGAKIIYCPSYWCAGDAGRGIRYDKNAEIKFVDSICSARAFENEVIVVYCNASGVFYGNKKDRLIGRSQVVVPFKGVVKKLNHNLEKMFIVEVDTKIIRDAEKSYKIRTDLKRI